MTRYKPKKKQFIDLLDSNGTEFPLNRQRFSQLTNLTLKSHYSLNHWMAIPSEYIQIISAGIYAIALFFTVATFWRTKRLDQITLSNNIFSHLRDLDIELAKLPTGSQYNDVRGQWFSRILNSVNWLSFMVNEKVINDKKMVEHIKPIIVRYYEDAFLKDASVDEKDLKFYPELEKLYRSIKK